jgi:Predicted glycosyltransferases
MVLNQNGDKWLPSLFDSLRKQDYPALLVYLIDNASTDDSVQLTSRLYPNVRILRLSQNAGYCMAYNLTMPVAFSDGCEWVVWANNDVLLEPGCLREMGRMASEHDDIGVIGPAFLRWDSDEPNYYMRGKHPSAIEHMRAEYVDPFEVDWVEGSFLMVRRQCVESVGWLDPLLFFYWEETDFCRRAKRNHWRIVMAPRALARHYAGGWSAGNHNNASTANFLKSRNQYIFALADPNRTFACNLIECVHLYLVLVKHAATSSVHHVIYETRAFVRLIPEIAEIWRKWRRDRIGLPPEPTTREYSGIRVEPIRSA